MARGRAPTGARRPEQPPALTHFGVEGMSREFNVLIERDAEGYLVASAPSLPGCHTQARSLDELMERVREAIELCLEVQAEEVDAGLEFVGVQRVSVRQ